MYFGGNDAIISLARLVDYNFFVVFFISKTNFRVSYSLDTDQVQHFVMPDLGQSVCNDKSGHKQQVN